MNEVIYVMNMRLVLFSGIVSSLAGMVIGVAATKIGQRDFNSMQYPSESYVIMYSRFIWYGAAIGASVGMAQECVRQLKQERDQEER